jgi:hypothetical protein
MARIQSASECACGSCAGSYKPTTPSGEVAYGGWICQCPCHRGPVHLRVPASAFDLTTVACKVQSWDFGQSTTNPSRVTCASCKNTKVFKKSDPKRWIIPPPTEREKEQMRKANEETVSRVKEFLGNKPKKGVCDELL